MKVTLKPVRRREVQKSTGFTTVQHGTRSGGRFRRPSESGSKRQELERKSGSGKEVSSRTLSVKANGTGVFSVCKSGSLRSTRAGACQQRASRVMLPLTAPCWVTLASGEHVVVQLDFDEELGLFAWDVRLDGGRT